MLDLPQWKQAGFMPDTITSSFRPSRSVHLEITLKASRFKTPFPFFCSQLFLQFLYTTVQMRLYAVLRWKLGPHTQLHAFCFALGIFAPMTRSFLVRAIHSSVVGSIISQIGTCLPLTICCTWILKSSNIFIKYSSMDLIIQFCFLSMMKTCYYLIDRFQFVDIH